MSKILPFLIIIFLSACNNEKIISKDDSSTETKTNTNQSLNEAEKEIMNFLHQAHEGPRFYTPSTEGQNLQGLNIYFDTCLSDASGSTHKDCDYYFRVTKKFENCPEELRDGDCDAADKEYSYPLGFLNSSIYILTIQHMILRCQHTMQ